jgi:3-oxoacyl-[acyl-carrier protein] reductase
MDLGLEGKRVVVGGGSKGLGRAIAEALLAEGAHVVLVSRDPEQAARELGGRATPFAADLAAAGDVERLVEHVRSQLGTVDGVLVNHGGPPGGDAFELTDEQWEDAFRLVIGGPIRLLRALVPAISDGGAIVWVTSSSVRQPIPKLDSSNVLRPGVAALVKCLSRELAPRVRVMGIMPGRIDTDRVRSLDEAAAGRLGRSTEEQRRVQEGTIPLGRYGETAEFGRVGAFLLSPAASYLTGSTVQVDGGLVTAIP